MKPIISIALFLVLNTGALALSSPATAGQNINSRMSSANKKGSARNDAQWSADPELGWRRIDERRKSSDTDQAPVGSGRHDGKQKSKGKANKS